MTESRDRLVRPLDLDAAFGRLRDGAIGDRLDLAPPVGSGWNRLGFGRRNFETPINGVARGRGGTPSTPLYGSARATASSVRGRFRTPTTVNPRARNLYASPVVRRQSSTLPSWFPRRPLRDVTHIVRALERTRSRLGVTEEERNDRESEGGAVNTPVPQPRAPMENYMPNDTPASSSRKKSLPPPSMLKVSKIIQSAATKPSNGDSEECLTPQKKLLAEIGTVEKLVMEELDKLKKTPSAKKAEREKRVNTLLSMR